MEHKAHFTTGFTYTFVVGEQPTADAQRFGGISLRQQDIETGHAEHSLHILWTADDIPSLLTALHRISDWYRFAMPNFSQYEGGLHGTLVLNHQLKREVARQPGGNLFRLGCVLYHQLLYRAPLELVL